MTKVEEYAERSPLLADAVIVVAVLGAGVLGLTLIGPDDQRPHHVWLAGVSVVVGCLALFGARRRPRAVVVVTTACVVVVGLLGYLLTPLMLAPLMVALYWLAFAVPSRTAWLYGGVSTVLVVAIAVGPDDFDATVAIRALAPALWLLLPIALGNRARLRHAYGEAVRARAEHAERTRDEEARLRVAEERMRIARDLHDVVAHHMAVAHAQAGTAAHLLSSDPERTLSLLMDLQSTTSTAMLELRDTVGVLRRGSSDVHDLEPPPGLERLPALIESYRSAGLDLAVEVEGESLDLAPGVDLTAYRIIQEALTNATKHADPPAARLRLTYGRSELGIVVRNARKARDATAHDLGGAPGYGVIGMQERARSVGGRLSVDDSSTDGFELVASLPLRPRDLAAHIPTPAEI